MTATPHTSCATLQAPATVLLPRATYHGIDHARGELDVGVIFDCGSYLLAWIGVSEDIPVAHVSELICSPPFDSLEALDAFCSANRAQYLEVGLQLHRRQRYPADNEWWWKTMS